MNKNERHEFAQRESRKGWEIMSWTYSMATKEAFDFLVVAPSGAITAVEIKTGEGRLTPAEELAKKRLPTRGVSYLVEHWEVVGNGPSRTAYHDVRKDEWARSDRDLAQVKDMGRVLMAPFLTRIERIAGKEVARKYREELEKGADLPALPEPDAP